MIISQVSYRTNGPLVLIFAKKHRLWAHVRTASPRFPDGVCVMARLVLKI